MARNQEKAQAMLNRWVQGKRDERTGAGGDKARRPHLASAVDSVSECEKWRGQVVRQIAKHVAVIQNAALGEHKIRDTNDRINRLMREKRAWEHQIKALGGNDYTRDGARVTDADGKRAFGADGYFYFGAARELPGVRELFEQKSAPEGPKHTRLELHKRVDADYYGYRDDDDGLLVPLEAAAEAAARARALDKHKKQQHALALARVKASALALGSDGKPLSEAALNQLAAKLTADAETTTAAAAASSSSSSASGAAMADDATGSSAGAAAAAGGELKAHVVLPTEQDLERAVLEKKRKDLLAKYGDASAAGAHAAAAAASGPATGTAAMSDQ